MGTWLKFIVIYYAISLLWCLPELSPYSLFELNTTVQASVLVFVPGIITVIWIAIKTSCVNILGDLLEAIFQALT